MKSIATFKTERGERFLGQMVKHFAHKIEANFEGASGYIKFDFGITSLTADADGLNMVVETPDEETLARVKDIIESHLVRFAFREGLESLDWHDFTVDA